MGVRERGEQKDNQRRGNERNSVNTHWEKDTVIEIKLVRQRDRQRQRCSHLPIEIVWN